MPPSPRYTVRLPPALDAQVQARVQAGTPFAVLIREALSAYLADTPPTPHADRQPTAADTVPLLTEAIQALTRRVEQIEHALTGRRQDTDSNADRMPTPADTPPPPPRTRARGELVTDVLHALAQRETATAAQVAQALGDGSQGGIKAVWQTLQRLRQRGAVVQEGRRYRLA